MKNNLRVLRAQHNLSQAEVADRVNVARQTINALETEKYSPSLELAYRLAKLFNCPVENIFDPSSVE